MIGFQSAVFHLCPQALVPLLRNDSGVKSITESTHSTSQLSQFQSVSTDQEFRRQDKSQLNSPVFALVWEGRSCHHIGSSGWEVLFSLRGSA